MEISPFPSVLVYGWKCLFFVVRIALLIKRDQQIEIGGTSWLVVSINMFKQSCIPQYCEETVANVNPTLNDRYKYGILSLVYREPGFKE